MNNPKVSVIIPVYNTEKYLKQCLDSLVNQTLSEIEIICINDGSTDSSLQILEEYAQKDTRIKIITQLNSNAGVARNIGLELATGEYLYFLDSDDLIAANTFLEEVYNQAVKNNLDIIVFRADILSTKNLLTISLADKHVLKGKIFNFKSGRMNPFGLRTTIWDKLYKREFISKNQIKFQEIKTCNDVYFSYTAMICADKIMLKNKVFIHYRQDSSNNITSTRNKHINNILTAILAVKEKLIEKNRFKTYENAFWSTFQSHIDYELSFCDKHQKELFSMFVKKSMSKKDINKMIQMPFEAKKRTIAFLIFLEILTLKLVKKNTFLRKSEMENAVGLKKRIKEFELIIKGV